MVDESKMVCPLWKYVVSGELNWVTLNGHFCYFNAS